MPTIYRVKEDAMIQSDEFEKLIRDLNEKDIMPILACTELSCLKFLDSSLHYIDAMDVLTKKSIEKSME